MKKPAILSLVVVLSMLLTIGISAGPISSNNTDTLQEDKTVTIEGLVRDIACPIQNPEATATHLNMKCLRACARKGSPLVILTPKGDLYLPISDKMPDTDQRRRLMPFLGKYVQATGKVFERNGTRSIVISSISERKDVHLTIDEQ